MIETMRLFDSPIERRNVAILLTATLFTSAIHFVDNALRLDLYPGPAWLTRNAVFLAWMVLPPLAWAVFLVRTRSALVAYALLGLAGLAHYFVPHSHVVPLRCTVTIAGEAITSIVLIAYVLRPGRAQREPIRPPKSKQM
jgi:hypothetical protein